MLVVGDLNPDLLVWGEDPVPRFGQQERDASMYMTLGGSAGHLRGGLRAAWVADVAGRVGRATTISGSVALGALRARGVDVGGVRVLAERRTGLSIHFLRADDRAILTERGAMAEVRVDDAMAALSTRSRPRTCI